MDDAVSDGDNTVTSISATNLTSQCKHKDGPRCLRNSKARFCVSGCWGKEMTSFKTLNIYDVDEGMNEWMNILFLIITSSKNTT